MNEAQPPQFRIVHLMYIVAMMGSSMALFGAWGALVGTCICLYWARGLYLGQLPFTCGEHIGLFVITGFVLALLPPNINFNARDQARSMECSNNMKILSIALMSYHSEYNTLPPAYIADEEGKPMHSWRVLILPFLEEQFLYDQYDFNEPWDGPNNIKLLNQMPEFYACPAAHHHQPGDEFCTNYVAITGTNTMWTKESPRRMDIGSESNTKTLLLTEFDDTKIPWLKPEDIEYFEAIKILSSTEPEVHKQTHKEHRWVLLSDGLNRYVHSGQPPELWEGIIGTNDEIDWESLELPSERERNRPATLVVLMRVVIFVVLLFLPLRWIRIPE